uniref:Tick transposon n=1 Tax=Rhipicephalus appendiculatus TaxID=34631 RepID=A0A131Z2E9_RHIAP
MSLKVIAGTCAALSTFSLGQRIIYAPNKLAQLCPRIMDTSNTGCQVKPTNRYTRCTTGVVYELPLTCGKSCVGQTGRYVNDRIRESANNFQK